MAVPSQSGALAYTGSAQTPAWANYESTKLTLGGTTSGTNAGSYEATFTPKDNYQCRTEARPQRPPYGALNGQKSQWCPASLGH